MAHGLSIIYQGGTVNLNSGSIQMLEQYVPQTGNGEWVMERVNLEFSGTSAGAVQAAIQSVNTAMSEAVRYQQTGAGTAVYVSFQPENYTSAYQSELIPADHSEWALNLDSDTLSRARWGGVSGGSQYKVAGNLIWKRRDYWQGALTPLTISNPNGTASTGIYLYNCNDGSVIASIRRVNYFYVAGSLIANADLPSPVRLEIFDSIGAAFFDPDRIWITARDYYSSTYGWVEGENAAASGGTPVANNSASGGTIYRYTLTSTYGTVGSGMTNYSLNSTVGIINAGILVRFASAVPQNTYCYLVGPNYSNIAGQEVVLDSSYYTQIVNVYRTMESVTSSDYLRLLFKNASGGTLDIDYLVAINLDNYVLIDGQVALEGASSDKLYYDSSKPRSFEAWADTYGGHYRRPCYGPGIYLIPGRNHYISIHSDCIVKDYEVGQEFKVKLSYYPRRRTL